MESVKLAEARAKLTALVRRIQKGERFMLTAHNRPVAALVSVKDARQLEGEPGVSPEPKQLQVSRVVKPAAELPPSEVPEGAVCGYQVRGGVCGRPAKFTRGVHFRCEEH